MSEIIKEIIEIAKNEVITFPEKFYKSSDNNTIMGEVSFKEILFLEYRDTEAGSNPREYAGLKKTNLHILRSILTDSHNMFRFLHSGVIVSLTTSSITGITGNTVKYEECCLTNGNQTRFIILIITLLKLFFNNEQIRLITSQEYKRFIKETFNDSNNIIDFLNYVKLNKISEIINYILKNNKYKKKFNELNISSFLDSRIRIQINLINSLIEDLGNEFDSYSAGTLIAEANNDTQNVKPDDIFGNKYKTELQDYIFKDFVDKFEGQIQIEYRYGEVVDKSIGKVHILTLLRLIIPTGLFTKDIDIYKLTNQRSPIYAIFSKLIARIEKNSDKAISVAKTVSKLIPLLYNIRKERILPNLETCKRKLVREYTKQAFAGDLQDSVIAKEIVEARGDDAIIERIVRGVVNYNVEHIMPVVVFRIRKLFKEETKNEINITIPKDIIDEYFTTLTEAIYDSYVKMKIKGLPSSLTTVVRGRSFYEFGTETYSLFKKIKNIEETNLVEKYQYILA